MITVSNVSKSFGTIQALNQVTMQMKEGNIYGLVGTNGSGKSTLLRILAGILRQEEGEVRIDNLNVFENPEAKRLLCFLPDTPYYFANARVRDMMEYYQIVYPEFRKDHFRKLLDRFELDPDRKLSTFSKGMKKQVSVLLGICAGTRYLLCDETFDGLDPVVREAVKRVFIDEIMERSFTPVIASHNLREMEDLCDHIGLLHRGGMVFSRDLEEMKTDIHRIQYVIMDPVMESRLLGELEVLKKETRGQLSCITVRGSEEEIVMTMESKKALYYEILPLSLEEIFISETEAVGYDIKGIIG